MPYSCPPSASVFRSVFVICFTVNAFVTCCVIVVYFCDYVWILACFYYFCCIVLKSLQHYLKHMLWICVCYDIWFIVCYYVQTYSINQRSYMVVTNWNGWCIVLVFASYQHCFCVVKNRILCAICTNQAYKKRNINGTKLIATSCFKIQENLLAVNLMINALQSILKLDWDSLHAFEHQCALSFHLFFTLFFF